MKRHDVKIHLGRMSHILLERAMKIGPETPEQKIELDWWEAGVPTKG